MAAADDVSDAASDQAPASVVAQAEPVVKKEAAAQQKDAGVGLPVVVSTDVFKQAAIVYIPSEGALEEGNPISWPDTPFLYLSSEAAPSCLVDGSFPRNNWFKLHPKCWRKSCVCGRQKCLGRIAKGKRKRLASLLVSPGSAQVQHWMLSLLSHGVGTPSLHIGNGQMEAPIFFSASSR